MEDFNKERATTIMLTRNDTVSKLALLKWVNQTLNCNITSLDHLRNGAIYCQLLHSCFPHALAIHKVHLYTNQEFEYLKNFKLLQAAFESLHITRDVPMRELIAGKDNLEFLQWFYKFHNANFSGQTYKPLLARKDMAIGMSESKHIWQYSTRIIPVVSDMPFNEKPAAIRRGYSNAEEVFKRKLAYSPNLVMQRSKSEILRSERLKKENAVVGSKEAVQDAYNTWKKLEHEYKTHNNAVSNLSASNNV